MILCFQMTDLSKAFCCSNLLKKNCHDLRGLCNSIFVPVGTLGSERVRLLSLFLFVKTISKLSKEQSI